MTTKLGIVMDSIASINPRKDSTLAMMISAQQRGWKLFSINQEQLFVADGKVMANAAEVSVSKDPDSWFSVIANTTIALDELDAVLMRKDPPFDLDFLYTTYLLEMAEKAGTPVLNRPGSIRDCNEKLFALQFPACTPPVVVTADAAVLTDFHLRHGDVIFKPLDGMGGASIFRLKADDPNRSVIIETLTHHGQHQIMAQKYLPEIVKGDSRILLINGEPIPYALARIPAEGETRGNLAAGGSGVGRELTNRDRFICEQVGPELKRRGLYFVGIDVIGDYLTEVNVTCPTCIQELDKLFQLDIAGDYMNFIEQEILA